MIVINGIKDDEYRVTCAHCGCVFDEKRKMLEERTGGIQNLTHIDCPSCDRTLVFEMGAKSAVGWEI